MHSPGEFQSAKLLVSILFTASILFGAFVVLSPFILAVIWAGILAVATWPVHEKILKRTGNSHGIAAACSTALVLFLLVGPMALLLVFLSQDISSTATFPP